MPGPARDFIIAPEVEPITVSLEPAQNAFQSLLLLVKADEMSGLGEWVTRTWAALTPQEREQHRLVLIGFYYALIPGQSWPSFPAYLDHLAHCDPFALREKMLRVYAKFPPLKNGQCPEPGAEPLPIDVETVLGSLDAYLSFLRERFGDEFLDVELETRAFPYVIDPPAMQKLVVSHLRRMWDVFLAPEWERVESMLQDAVRAFQQGDMSEMSRLEAARFITGQPLKEEKWEHSLKSAERVIFVPSAHYGPYQGQLWSDTTLWLLFGARLPAGSQFQAPDLSRAEILVRLSALDDDNRLRIIRLIGDKGELRSQEVMELLDLSQSAASRHLKQLSAVGYLTERRCNGAKCYDLDSERIEETLQAISAFLLGS